MDIKSVYITQEVFCKNNEKEKLPKNKFIYGRVDYINYIEETIIINGKIMLHVSNCEPLDFGYKLNDILRNQNNSNLKFLPRKLSKGSRYHVGSYYWCGYWQKWYKVLEVNYEEENLKNVKIQWEDGKIAEHCTRLDYLRDYELIKIS